MSVILRSGLIGLAVGLRSVVTPAALSWALSTGRLPAPGALRPAYELAVEQTTGSRFVEPATWLAPGRADVDDELLAIVHGLVALRGDQGCDVCGGGRVDELEPARCFARTRDKTQEDELSHLTILRQRAPRSAPTASANHPRGRGAGACPQ